MAASGSTSGDEGCEAPLLPIADDATVHGVVDYKDRRPVSRSNTGGWRSAGFIIGVEITERFAYYGIESNLISYLTGPLQQPMAMAAENVNAWSGAASILPLLGAFVADAWLGRYRAIIFSSLLYILGLSLLTLSAVLPSHGSSNNCHNTDNNTSCRPPQFQIILFFSSLYLVALGQGGHKPSVQAFGADQFDVRHPQECKSRSSFFNWWYFGMCVGLMFTIPILTYIQDNLSWGFGFGIPCIAMAIGLAVFFLGTKTYRYSFNETKTNPFTRIVQVFVAAARNWQIAYSPASIDKEVGETLPRRGSNQFKFLDKALATASDGSNKEWEVCSADQVEDAKAVLRLVPIWTTCLVYAIVFSQPPTFFTKQGATMDRSIGSGFEIPAASLQTLITFSIVTFVPIYDRIIVPIARFFTKRHSGFRMLQRIGTGMIFSTVAMVVAAIVEKQRLQIAIDSGLVDNPKATVPMSVWWLVPQYVLIGVADVFTMVGLQEFFYDQVPNGLRSLGLSLYLSIFGIGSFLSTFLISAIEKATGGADQDSWFSNNINRAHIDYFYWLLAGLSAIQLAFYLYFAKSYIYKGETI
ncbi:protein NRT1/ PTR FAMILY 5.10-like [Macadamia integrifolia]|uniref:protein NRT1/ PTR FAMILY 5.10-like n=1 Tax=Macadamia integrifolia TaxID=60698 RepID=UPI001C4E77ED|nr:protein NRT1/ PTR FAMILY 5.10-like [Macadamia integrifolia]